MRLRSSTHELRSSSHSKDPEVAAVASLLVARPHPKRKRQAAHLLRVRVLGQYLHAPHVQHADRVLLVAHLRRTHVPQQEARLST